uniref:Retrotransposon gag domain-containing protein n=1 Tax=Carica papaya TaxID=3649 RepID=A0A4D6D261_CARPA|nr:hypothetical protein sunset.v10033650 [Carica papaya]
MFVKQLERLTEILQNNMWIGETTRSVFEVKLHRKFEGLAEVDIAKEFNKLIQEDIVLQYQGKFEEVMSPLLTENPELFKKYFISSFTSDLNNELQPTVKMHKSRTLTQAFELLLLQEQ